MKFELQILFITTNGEVIVDLVDVFISYMYVTISKSFESLSEDLVKATDSMYTE